MTAPRTSLRARAAGGLVAIALLAGCGGGGGAGKAAADPTTTTVDRGAATAALEAKLLTPADLATGDALDAGWDVGDVSAGVDIKLPDCVQEPAADGAAVAAGTKLVTKNDLKLPSVQEALATFDKASGASAAFAAAAKRLDACDATFVFQGAKAVGAIVRLPLTLAGSDAQAWRTTVTIAGVAVSITNIHVVQRSTEVALVHVDLDTPEPAVLEALATKALAKLA